MLLTFLFQDLSAPGSVPFYLKSSRDNDRTFALSDTYTHNQFVYFVLNGDHLRGLSSIEFMNEPLIP